jgi:hypothetical protein
MFMKTTQPYYLNMAPFQNKKARNPPPTPPKILASTQLSSLKYGDFFEKIPKIFLDHVA